MLPSTMETGETVPLRNHARSSPSSEDLQRTGRDEELWYGDGTLILIAANVEFRIDGGPLAKHSPVFRDILALPQPPVDQIVPVAFEGAIPAPP